MYDFYLFSLITSLALLVLWQTLGKSKVLRRFFGTLFLFSIIAYAFSLFDLHLKDFHSMKVLFRDLMMLTLVSFISLIARKTSLGALSWLLISGFAIYTVYQNKEILVPKDFELDQSAELLVKLKFSELPAGGSALHTFLESQNVSYSSAFLPIESESTELDNYIVLDLPDELTNSVALFEFKKDLAALESVVYIEDNEMIQVAPLASIAEKKTESKVFNDPLSEDQWALDALNVSELQELLSQSTPVKKARLFILDTGIDAAHEDLKSNYRSHKKKYDTDVQSHGTHCAGIASAVTNNGTGVASLNLGDQFFTVSAIKVLNDRGMGTQKKIIDGILEAADNGADVISLSLGGRSTDRRQKVYEETVSYANRKGAIVVVAAGNSSMNARGYSPANTNGVITVAAVDSKRNLAPFSNTVEDLRMGISAPGVGILSTIPGNQYKAYNGTSMATPYVAGLVTIMKSFDPELSTEYAYQMINANGQFVASSSKSGNLIDPAKTIKSLIGK